MPETFSDWVAITNNATADSESAQGSINIQGGAHITKIAVFDVATGHTYAVKLEATGMATPQKYLIASNGALPNTNGGKQFMGKAMDVDVEVPSAATNILVSTFADIASATCKVCITWQV